ncbi:hypothetical protein PVK06_015533 [Gossypium arboreum]|uniref:Uncharacterized protein n=1 Tax=Gossypium arboreum TaxID=29729 RepID=A0ABR0PXU0_GOSAR|nr:hypothetical protein PVK06_015533 [Gossypium arboreum]
MFLRLAERFETQRSARVELSKGPLVQKEMLPFDDLLLLAIPKCLYGALQYFTNPTPFFMVGSPGEAAGGGGFLQAFQIPFSMVLWLF